MTRRRSKDAILGSVPAMAPGQDEQRDDVRPTSGHELDRNLGRRIETFEGPLHDWVRSEVERKQAQKQAGLKGN